MNTYSSLKPDSIVLLMEQPSVIATRRLQRDGVVVKEADIESFQREEKIYAEEIAKKLGVPLVVYTCDETRKFIEWLNSEGYSLASTYGGGARWVYVNIDTKAYIRGKQGMAFSQRFGECFISIDEFI